MPSHQEQVLWSKLQVFCCSNAILVRGHLMLLSVKRTTMKKGSFFFKNKAYCNQPCGLDEPWKWVKHIGTWRYAIVFDETENNVILVCLLTGLITSTGQAIWQDLARWFMQQSVNQQCAAYVNGLKKTEKTPGKKYVLLLIDIIIYNCSAHEKHHSWRPIIQSKNGKTDGYTLQCAAKVALYMHLAREISGTSQL